MKKLIALICLLASLISLCGCSYRRRRWYDEETQIAMADAFAQTVIDAIVHYDEQTFDALFTDEALRASGFQKGKDYLFDIFEGEVLQAYRVSIVLGGGYSKYGKSYKPHVSWDIQTDKHTYCLYIQFILDGYLPDTGKHYVNKIKRLRLAIESELPETGAFNNNGGLGAKLGIYYPGIDPDTPER